MAQPQIFDYAALHRVGYAAAGGDRRYTPQRQTSALENFAFRFLGNQVIDYTNAWKQRKRDYQENNINFSQKMAATIAEDPFTANSDVSTAIQEFSLMRDEGQRLVSKYHGFPNSKKYKKGVEMMNQSQTKLENLQTSMANRLTFNNNLKSVTLNGYYINSEGEKVYTELDDKANEQDVTNRGYASMDGTLDQSIQVNRETGFLEVLEEDYSNVKGIGILKLEDLGKPKIKITPWNELQLPKFKDKSGYGLSTDASTYGMGLGKEGLPWDGAIEAGSYDMAQQKIDALNRTAFNSWFFNGTHYNFGDAGTTFTSPAEAFLAKEFPQYEKDSVEWKGAMESLRKQNLSEVDGYREFAIKHYVDVAKQYHGIAKAAYDKEHAKDPNVVKQTKWEAELERDRNSAVSMLSGKNTQYSKDKMYEFKNDGFGNTEILIRQSVDKQDGTDPVIKYVPFKEMSTNDALKFRRLDNLVPSEYLYPEKTEATNGNLPASSSANNPITDYEKRNGKWYYIKGGKNVAVNKSNYPRLEAQAKIAKYS